MDSPYRKVGSSIKAQAEFDRTRSGAKCGDAEFALKSLHRDGSRLMALDRRMRTAQAVSRFSMPLAAAGDSSSDSDGGGSAGGGRPRVLPLSAAAVSPIPPSSAAGSAAVEFNVVTHRVADRAANSVIRDAEQKALRLQKRVFALSQQLGDTESERDGLQEQLAAASTSLSTANSVLDASDAQACTERQACEELAGRLQACLGREGALLADCRAMQLGASADQEALRDWAASVSQAHHTHSCRLDATVAPRWETHIRRVRALWEGAAQTYRRELTRRTDRIVSLARHEADGANTVDGLLCDKAVRVGPEIVGPENLFAPVVCGTSLIALMFALKPTYCCYCYYCCCYQHY
jgi:hypothetical protein